MYKVLTTQKKSNQSLLKYKMEAFLKTMEKSLKTYGEGIVKQLSIKYGFDLIEGQEVLETSKPKKVEKVEKEKKEKKEPQKRGRKPKKDSV